MNPARSLGPDLILGGTALKEVWLFIVAPLLGAVGSSGLYIFFTCKKDAKYEKKGKLILI